MTMEMRGGDWVSDMRPWVLVPDSKSLNQSAGRFAVGRLNLQAY
jgi:hypothetical protein